MDKVSKYIQTNNPIPIRINGEYKKTDEVIDVISPFTKNVVSQFYSASISDIDNAIDVAYSALEKNEFKTFQRAQVLDKAAELIIRYKEDFAKIIATESAKSIKTARIEVDRAVQTFLFSASVARSASGEMIAIDSHPSGDNKLAFTFREPIGVIGAIAPFNFPLNLVAHKVAPAIAAGAPVVLKPAHNTPLTSAFLVDLLIDEAGLDPAYLSFIPCPGEVAARLSENEKVAMISFTGSPGVGWSIKQKAYKKKVALELGNNAPVIVEPDSDIEKVTSLVAASGYSFQGQSCISVQRVYVHESIFDRFVDQLKTKVESLIVGDPLDDATDVSALISPKDNERVIAWIKAATENGAKLITGGTQSSQGVLAPTILTDATEEMDVCRKEVFGPLVSVMKYSELNDALLKANTSDYGLQAAIFTSNISRALHAAKVLNFGGVLINETPTYRADNMPYGGIKDSGNTKEGPAYTYHEMTKEKLVVIATD
ncbi:MAG: aldehyde dehydrogenase family protein [Acidimicrobiia bacterium]